MFDPQAISYRDLLEFFFQIHDPTTRNRQGNDLGASYRSAIFYTSEAQRQAAEDRSPTWNASGLWQGKVVTEVAPAGPFWEAGPEHQDYLRALPERLHLPLPATELEASSPRARLCLRRQHNACLSGELGQERDVAERNPGWRSRVGLRRRAGEAAHCCASPPRPAVRWSGNPRWCSRS